MKARSRSFISAANPSDHFDKTVAPTTASTATDKSTPKTTTNVADDIRQSTVGGAAGRGILVNGDRGRRRSSRSGLRLRWRRGTKRPSSLGTNNSMPMADKAYDAPEPPEEMDAYKFDLADTAIQYRQALRPFLRNYVTMYFRVRRHNYEQLLWQCVRASVFPIEKMYTPANLPFWTVSMKMRVRDNYPLGQVLQAMKCRLGINNPGLRFCLDGFFGMANYADIFGNTGDVCPWMEVSSCSTVRSLRLKDGDSIYISIASSAQIERVLQWRKRRATEPVATHRASQAKPARPSRQSATSAASLAVEDFAASSVFAN